MRSEIKKIILANFKSMFKQSLPGYKFFRGGFPHRSAFRYEHNADLQLYCLLQWHSFRDEYAIGVGWSYQKTLDEMCGILDPENALSRDGVVINLDDITRTPNSTWWNVRSCFEKSEAELTETNTQFMTLLQSSFRSLLEIGIPYLDRVVAIKTPL